MQKINNTRGPQEEKTVSISISTVSETKWDCVSHEGGDVSRPGWGVDSGQVVARLPGGALGHCSCHVFSQLQTVIIFILYYFFNVLK